MAETLAQIVSVAEQDGQELKKAEPQRHMSFHLDGQLTIQTTRRFMSNMPSNPEELRLKYKVLSNCWLMGQLRQPGRHLFSDLDRNTFADFLDVLLSEKNFLLTKNLGTRLVSVHRLRIRTQKRGSATGSGKGFLDPASTLGSVQQ